MFLRISYMLKICLDHIQSSSFPFPPSRHPKHVRFPSSCLLLLLLRPTESDNCCLLKCGWSYAGHQRCSNFMGAIAILYPQGLHFRDCISHQSLLFSSSVPRAFMDKCCSRCPNEAEHPVLLFPVLWLIMNLHISSWSLQREPSQAKHDSHINPTYRLTFGYFHIVEVLFTRIPTLVTGCPFMLLLIPL